MITIVHPVGSWLPITETWLHTQVASLTERVDCHILCSHRENLDHQDVISSVIASLTKQ